MAIAALCQQFPNPKTFMVNIAIMEKKFKDFGFIPEIMEGLEAMGFDEPTEVQSHSIPIILEGKDVIACAQTGTGKTAAFLLPILHQIQKNPDDKIKALVIAPTRELVMQIDQQLEGFSYFTGATSIAIYGGGSGSGYEQEKKALKSGTDVIIATPGRLISHINMKYVDFSGLTHFVLDEADRMLDMGFAEDLTKIARELPTNKQTVMFSATMPPKIRGIAKKIMKEPKEVNISISKTAEGILQAAYLVYDVQKTELLKSLIDGKEELNSIIIFTSKKVRVKEIVKELKKLGMDVEGISSDLEQEEREEVLRKFRNKRLQILVGTDIISRGIDIESIDLVINYDVPKDPEDYVHRVGRTARAKSTGVALTFINDSDQKDFMKIEKLLEKKINKIPLPPFIGEGPRYEESKSFKPKTHRNYRKKPQRKK